MRNFTILIFIAIIVSCLGTLNAQIVISKPNLGFTQACASASFNSFDVTFSFSPEANLNPSNQFIVELSDATGSFSNTTTVYTSTAGSITTSPVTISISLPTTTSGESYKLRVKSTAPAVTSSASNAFPAYYKIQDAPFSINNLVETGVYCSGGSYLLIIDNPGGAMNDSPLQYPSLSFNWYKETSPTTSVFVASGESLSVSGPGTYFVETDYGSCTSNSFSNRVTISEASSGTATSSISSSLGNPYCSADGPTILSAINGVAYQWYKDGNEIAGATNQMYQTNEDGTYAVTIDLGDCTASATITLENTGFESSIDVDVGQPTMLPDGETLDVTVTTTAVNPEFKWYLNDVVITGANNSTYEVLQEGNYKAIINQMSGCLSSKEFSFRVTEPFPDVLQIPNVITPNGDGTNDTWVIPQAYVSGTNTEVTLYTARGKVALSTKDYQNNWPEKQLNFKDVSPIFYYIIKTENQKTIKGSITVVK
ncbi:gliding motility-associated C-terminal domain-containing protein [Algibacter sp. 2305UL17-15]|uniref:T9SS type B sorting domain-containing protein n=1 Tax=Algibacter sp. 2305UL17-15 TaxID=3231268 RepID=UPI00345858D8